MRSGNSPGVWVKRVGKSENGGKKAEKPYKSRAYEKRGGGCGQCSRDEQLGRLNGVNLRRRTQ